MFSSLASSRSLESAESSLLYTVIPLCAWHLIWHYYLYIALQVWRFYSKTMFAKVTSVCVHDICSSQYCKQYWDARIWLWMAIWRIFQLNITQRRVWTRDVSMHDNSSSEWSGMVHFAFHNTFIIWFCILLIHAIVHDESLLILQISAGTDWLTLPAKHW